jgi:hypothetical protein
VGGNFEKRRQNRLLDVSEETPTPSLHGRQILTPFTLKNKANVFTRNVIHAIYYLKVNLNSLKMIVYSGKCVEAISEINTRSFEPTERGLCIFETGGSRFL